MTIGSNSDAATRMQAVVERIERVRADKQQCTLDENAIMAEAKSDGFHGPAIKAILKIRKQKPQERAENEAILDTYLFAMGMANEPPIHQAIKQISADIASRDSVVEAMKHLVPTLGSITIETSDGKPVKLTRDKDGVVSVTEIVERPATEAAGPKAGTEGRQRPQAPPAPDVDAEGAEQLGREAFVANRAIISNPFPFGDERRGRWDTGWRKASGGDGMGPNRGDD